MHVSKHHANRSKRCTSAYIKEINANQNANIWSKWTPTDSRTRLICHILLSHFRLVFIGSRCEINHVKYILRIHSVGTLYNSHGDWRHCRVIPHQEFLHHRRLHHCNSETIKIFQIQLFNCPRVIAVNNSIHARPTVNTCHELR